MEDDKYLQPRRPWAGGLGRGTSGRTLKAGQILLKMVYDQGGNPEEGPTFPPISVLADVF